MSETGGTVLLKYHLKAFKVPPCRGVREVAQRCPADNTDDLASLLQLCELEPNELEPTAAERRLKEARHGRVRLANFRTRLRPQEFRHGEHAHSERAARSISRADFHHRVGAKIREGSA